MNQMSQDNVSRISRAMPVSRVLRFLVGAAITGLMIPPLLRANAAGLTRVAMILAGLLVLYTGLHWLVGRYFGWINPWLGSVIVVMPVFVVFTFGGAYEVAAVLYVGISLMVIALAGKPGCECVAIPILLSGKGTPLACVAFTPLDWVEERVTQRLSR